MKIAQIPMADDRKTGYGFLSRITKMINGRFAVGYHPGEDLNSGTWGGSDRGLPVTSFSNGVVIFKTKSGGWGNLLVIWHDHLKVWSRYAHFDTINVKVGDRVTLQTVIGTCGSTGTTSPHSHFEIVQKKLNKWTDYVWGWPKKKVMEYFLAPYEFIHNINEKYKKDLLLPDWAVESWERATEKGIAPDNPHQEIDMTMFQEMLKSRGIITEIGTMPVYRALVVIDKMKDLI